MCYFCIKYFIGQPNVDILLNDLCVFWTQFLWENWHIHTLFRLVLIAHDRKSSFKKVTKSIELNAMKMTRDWAQNTLALIYIIKWVVLTPTCMEYNAHLMSSKWTICRMFLSCWIFRVINYIFTICWMSSRFSKDFHILTTADNIYYVAL